MALHKHRCENPHCGLIFQHDVPDTSGMKPAQAQKFYDAGHMCPRCHTGPYTLKYFSSREEKLQQLEEFLEKDPIFQLLSLFTDREKLVESVKKRISEQNFTA
jgi:rubredoxin